MSRTYGARDKKKRKERSDKKHRYINRNGHMVRYVPKRSRDSLIKIWFWQRVPMSRDSVGHWAAHLRPSIKKVVTRFGPRLDVDPVDISTPERIAALAEAHLYEGVWLMMGFGHGKTRTRVKVVKLCRVVIRETPEGLRATVSDVNRLSRYWFWRGS